MSFHRCASLVLALVVSAGTQSLPLREQRLVCRHRSDLHGEGRGCRHCLGGIKEVMTVVIPLMPYSGFSVLLGVRR